MGTETTTAAWSAADLAVFDAQHEASIRIAVDGQRAHRFVPVWIVTAREQVFVRSATSSPRGWYAQSLLSRRGTVRATGLEVDVTVVSEDDSAVLDLVDDAWMSKYGRWEKIWNMPILTDPIRHATVRLSPMAPGREA